MGGYIGNSVVGVEHPSKSALNATTGDFTGAVTAASTLGVTGAVTANAGVVVDNITIDGTEIDLSSGDLTIDVAGDITLDADGADIIFADGGTTFLEIDKDGNNSRIKNPISDGDIKFQGNDGGSIITALDLDMSDNGAATLSNGLTLTDGDLVVASGHGISFAATSDASGMTSEILDEYEEGTFTPTIAGENTASIGTSSVIGLYTKIGRLVNCSITYSVNSISGGASNLAVDIAGLPFTTNTNSNFAAAIRVQNLASAVEGVQVIYFNNATSGRIEEFSGTGGSNFSDHVASNSTFVINATYMTA